MSERHSLAWAGDVSPAVETYVPSMGKFLFSLFVVLLILPASARQIHVKIQDKILERHQITINMLM